MVLLYVANLCSIVVVAVLIPCDLANLIRRYQEYFSKSLDTQILRFTPGITATTTGSSGNRGVLQFRRTRRSFVRLLNGQAENGLVAEDKARQGLKYVKILKQQFITEKNLKLHNCGDMDLSAFEAYFDISQNGIRGRSNVVQLLNQSLCLLLRLQVGPCNCGLDYKSQASLNRKVQVWKLLGHERRGSRYYHRA
jgi:hypothetical protein